MNNFDNYLTLYELMSIWGIGCENIRVLSGLMQTENAYN